MKERFPQKGFQSHPSIEFRQNPGSDGIGVFASSDIRKDEILLVIPESTRFSVETVTAGDGDLRRLAKQVELRCQPWRDVHPPSDFSLALAIMYVLAKASKQQDHHTTNEWNWKMQAATWPSDLEMKQSSIFYLSNMDDTSDANDKANKFWVDCIGKCFLSEAISDRLKLLQQVFQNVILPVLDEADAVERFCPLPQDTNQEVLLWENFRHAFSLVWSRCHENHATGAPELVPLIELFNGAPDDTTPQSSSLINVNIALGKWPFLRGDMFRNDCNLPCSAIYAKRDITKGEELILSYGSLEPTEFLMKYGTVPRSLIVDNSTLADKVYIWCPPDLVPMKDKLRVKALEGCNGFPLEDFMNGTIPLTTLSTESLWCYRYNNSFQETEEVKWMRQFLILGHLASDDEVQQKIHTGRLQVANPDPHAIGRLILQVVDYNIKLLSGVNSRLDMEQAQQKQPVEAGLLFARVCQRETLLQWRFRFCKCYGLPFKTTTIDGGCVKCGRSYPKLTCARCKSQQYCSRQHQKQAWKHHKLACQAK